MKRVFLLISAFSIACILGYSQQNATSPSKNISENTWKPLKLDAAGKNLMNGVEFYRKTADCNSQKYIFVRLVNSNNHAVKIKWSASEGHNDFVVVGPLSELEGNCQTQTKLIIVKKEGEEEKLKKQFLSQLQVEAVKN